MFYSQHVKTVEGLTWNTCRGTELRRQAVGAARAHVGAGGRWLRRM